MTELSGATALITGGGSGIGRLLAHRFAARGARVVVFDLAEPHFRSVLDEVRAAGGQAWGYACDVTDRQAVQDAAALVRDEVGDVDIVVNNAGVVSGNRLLDLPDDKIERTFAVNTLALYWVTKAFLPAMVRHNRGHVVTIASAAGLVGVARQTDYSASKHAAVGFDESLRVELGQVAPGVVTTVVCPFYVDTGMFEGVKTRFPRLLPILRQDDVADRIVQAIVRNRRRLIMPPLVKFLPVMRVLPPRGFDRLMGLFGVNKTMDTFTGRAQQSGPASTSLPGG
jgi:all-trans-retinol dehydrogenase (NAD+)